MMKWLDALFAWALVLLGSAHFLSQWIPKLGLLRGPWAAGAAVAIISMGLMNAVRTRRQNDAFLRWCTVAATALTAGLCLPLSLPMHLPMHLPTLHSLSGNILHPLSGNVFFYNGFLNNVVHHPAGLATGVLALVELLFALAG